MQYNYIWFICTLLDSCVPIRILGHLIRLYIGSWQDYSVLPMGLAGLTGLANESCQMFGGILPSMVRILFCDYAHVLILGHMWARSTRRYPWLMSLAPTIGGSGWLADKNKTSMRKKFCSAMACGKRKPLWGKNPNKPVPACKNLVCAGKNSSWCVTCVTYIMTCIKYKRKCLWRGRMMS